MLSYSTGRTPLGADPIIHRHVGHYAARKYQALSADEISAASQQVKGSVKEAIGTLTGDRATEMGGAAEKTKAEAGESSTEETEDRSRP